MTKEESAIWDRMAEAADELWRRHGDDKVAAFKEIGVKVHSVKTPFGTLTIIEGSYGKGIPE